LSNYCKSNIKNKRNLVHFISLHFIEFSFQNSEAALFFETSEFPHLGHWRDEWGGGGKLKEEKGTKQCFTMLPFTQAC